MNISTRVSDERVADVRCTEDDLIIDLMDGRTISVPLAWYPRLLAASASERANWQRSGGGYGIHWPDIDEDLSTEGLLRGAPAPRAESALWRSPPADESVGGVSSVRRAKRPLYIVIKPPAPRAKEIWGLPQTWRRRPPELLHLTLLPLWDAADLPSEVTTRVCEMLSTVRASPFEVVFNRVKGKGGSVELISSKPLPELKAFRELVADTLIKTYGVPLKIPGRLRPHITIDYRKSSPNVDLSIEPISWEVDDFLLIESVVGETRHIAHGRWQLRS
jgi:2'-5' RNA ligase